MLFNPNWKKETKDLFSLQSLIAWLETKPANEVYDSGSPRNCMLGQWIASTGASEQVVFDCSYHIGNERGILKTVAGIDAPRDQLRTFGAALDRARAAAQS